MSTSEIIQKIATMEGADLALVSEKVRSREEELLRAEVGRRREDLRSGRVRALTHGEVFGPMKAKFAKSR